MKKLLRLILIFLVFALMAALSAITALACSPDDNNPEHHENVIQPDEKKPTCLEGGYYRLQVELRLFHRRHRAPRIRAVGDRSGQRAHLHKSRREASLLQYMQQVVSRARAGNGPQLV